jgi:predicted transcriptional regulator
VSVDGTPIQGELQVQLMQVVWRSGGGTVEAIRSALPPRYRGAYTTVQTVLNRLAERGLLVREKRGVALHYTPTTSEAEYLSKTLRRTLAGASSEARAHALASLLGDFDTAELSELQERARRAAELEHR